jgi:hypothetical protein
MTMVHLSENRKTLFLLSKWRFDGISEDKGIQKRKSLSSQVFLGFSHELG